MTVAAAMAAFRAWQARKRAAAAKEKAMKAMEAKKAKEANKVMKKPAAKKKPAAATATRDIASELAFVPLNVASEAVSSDPPVVAIVSAL